MIGEPPEWALWVMVGLLVLLLPTLKRLPISLQPIFDIHPLLAVQGLDFEVDVRGVAHELVI